MKNMKLLHAINTQIKVLDLYSYILEGPLGMTPRFCTCVLILLNDFIGPCIDHMFQLISV